MKTFDSEYKELVDWMKMETKEHMEKYKIKMNSADKELDGDLCYERAQVVQEYNRRLDALKKKYGKDIIPQTAAATSRSEAERVKV